RRPQARAAAAGGGRFVDQGEQVPAGHVHDLTLLCRGAELVELPAGQAVRVGHSVSLVSGPVGPTACSIASRAVRPVRPAARSVELAGAEALAPGPSVPGGRRRAARVPAGQPPPPTAPTAALSRSWTGIPSRAS